MLIRESGTEGMAPWHLGAAVLLLVLLSGGTAIFLLATANVVVRPRRKKIRG